MSTQLQAARPFPAGTWSIDPARSAIRFQVRHLMFASVKGRFTEFDGAVEVDAAGELRVSGTVRAASVTTYEAKRDEHLRSADFFDVDAFPELIFASTVVEPLGESRFRIVGDLTLKDVTRPIELTANVAAADPEPDGRERLSIQALGELDRTAFGLTWNRAQEAGGAAVGETVRFRVDVSAVQR